MVAHIIMISHWQREMCSFQSARRQSIIVPGVTVNTPVFFAIWEGIGFGLNTCNGGEALAVLRVMRRLIYCDMHVLLIVQTRACPITRGPRP